MKEEGAKVLAGLIGKKIVEVRVSSDEDREAHWCCRNTLLFDLVDIRR